jgi:hypothetical protein
MHVHSAFHHARYARLDRIIKLYYYDGKAPVFRKSEHFFMKSAHKVPRRFLIGQSNILDKGFESYYNEFAEAMHDGP